jgi:transcription antitermination factor NusG
MLTVDTPSSVEPAPPPAPVADKRVGSGWVAVWTRSRHEQVARAHLTTRGIEVFLPLVSRWSQRRNHRLKIDWPLFPGYCFAHITPNRRVDVLSCPGVVNLVSVNGAPALVPPDEIDGIRRLIATGMQYQQHPCIREGTTARVVSGPLTGVVGRVVRTGSQTRLILSVELISAAVSVEVDASDVVADATAMTPHRGSAGV